MGGARRRRGQVATMEELSFREVEAATGGFALETMVGKGSHGCVYRGVIGGGRVVAVKRLSRAGSTSGKARMRKEIEILESISSPQFVNIVGVGQGEEEAVILMEYMPNGSLHDLLHLSERPLPYARRLLIALQIARAMRELHQAVPPVIHRDIKSSNVLFDSRWNAKLADFSLAVRQTGSDLSAPSPAGTIGYLDPCYTGPGKLGPENDVFSYGVILLELVSGRQVMDAACETTSIIAWAEPLLCSGQVAEVCDPRLGLPRSIKKIITQVLKLAMRCILLEATERPTAGEIAEELQSIVEYLRLSIWGHLKNNIQKMIYPHLGNWAARRGARITATRIICTDHLCKDDDKPVTYDSAGSSNSIVPTSVIHPS